MLPLSVQKRTYYFGNWICFSIEANRWRVATLLVMLETADLNKWTSGLKFSAQFL